ncbi:MAG TPA: alkaline phosphatase family protein [Actinomycetota bacterium]
MSRIVPRRTRSGLNTSAAVLITVAVVMMLAWGEQVGTLPAHASDSPIQHVVVIFQENHSFDNVLGQLCIQDSRCNGADTGQVATGETIPLSRAKDIVAQSPHGFMAEALAIDGGKMDGFSNYPQCSEARGYKCYTQYYPDQIPNLAALARAFVISDNTFELRKVASYPSHIEIVSASTAGYIGGVTKGQGTFHGGGWGCDSWKDAQWKPLTGGPESLQPACVPDQNGNGPYRPSLVQYQPTIMDRLDAAGLSWHIYSPQHHDPGYNWSICPVYAECLYGPQFANMREPTDVLTDAAAGTLPTFSVVVPFPADSQHNKYSMTEGDNWIGSVVSAIEDGPDWDTTAIFITYDDCGCFYDHVPPPGKFGIRTPMVIVSPFAKPGYTDSTLASYASILAFTEHTFDLDPLNADDAAAYDYTNSFDFTQTPNLPVRMVKTPVPNWELDYIAAHPGDPNDPT